MQTLVVPKNRKPRFELAFKVLDLNNIPYRTGNVLVKWHAPLATDHGDRTSRAPIKDHKAIFGYEKTLSIKLVVDKNGVLQESNLVLEVIHEVVLDRKDERTQLGTVRINLAEYVEATRSSHDPIQRRYLLQESKINSTLKVAIHLNQIEGDRSYLAPPLRSAPVFVGIAGILAGEDAANAELSETPIVNPRDREGGDDLRDLYRSTLAAELTCQPGVPSADQVVEDIFNGGDGWCGVQPYDTPSTTSNNSRRQLASLTGGVHADDSSTWSDEGTLQTIRPNKRSWPEFQLTKSGRGRRNAIIPSGSRGSFAHSSISDDKDYSRTVPEVDEMEARDDLRCWNYQD